MKFLSAKMEQDFPATHPDLRRLLVAFDAFSAEADLPEPIVTDLCRDGEAQARIYTAHYRRLQAALERGPQYMRIDPEDDGTYRPLSKQEQREAYEVSGKSEAQLRQRALGRFTWHFCRCAADLRTRHYSAEQLKAARGFFAERDVRLPGWEFLVHDITAPHAHVARRDFEWRARFSPAFPIK